MHVSATPGSSAEVLGRSLPILLEEGATFKVAASLSVVAALNDGDGGLSQIGKFITVYPRDAEQAVRLARALDAATDGLRGPRISTDRELRPGSLVHYRYGAFVGRPDDVEPTPPTTNPFVEEGTDHASTQRLIAGRYVVVSTLHRSASGSVLLAADVVDGMPRVLKRGERDARVGPDGRDARDHLRHEASVLERLAADPRFPRVHGVVEEGGDLYLVLDHLSGRPLGSLVSGPCAPERAMAWGRQLVSMLAAVHDAGIVYRDVSPANVLVADDDTLQLVDFELARVAGSSGEPAGTPGYCSPQQRAGEPASVADDVYGVGAMLRFLETGQDPDGLVGPGKESPLERLIARCLDGEPEGRFASMPALDAALEELQVSR